MKFRRRVRRIEQGTMEMHAHGGGRDWYVLSKNTQCVNAGVDPAAAKAIPCCFELIFIRIGKENLESRRRTTPLYVNGDLPATWDEIEHKYGQEEQG
jgi:hypothetical protein